MIDIRTTVKLSKAPNGGASVRVPKAIKDLMNIQSGQSAIVTADAETGVIEIRIKEEK